MTAEAETHPPDLPGLQYVQRLGQGGYADVFLYEQASPRMLVAVKVLSADGLTDQTIHRFGAEANAMAELAGHPNIVQVFRTDITSDGRPYLVMKYYPERNMAVRSRLEHLSVPEVLRIGIRIACAVETAHRAGILHRDIKPANILTSLYGEPGLTDFGIATTAGEGAADAEAMSVPWAPPEVLFATSAGGRAADVYALGATLWHLLAGRSPFEVNDGDNSALALMRRIRELPPPRTGRADVPASLERLLAQTLAKRAEDRPQTALQLARTLQGIETEQRLATTPLVLLDLPTEGDGSAGAAAPSDAVGGDAGPGETRIRSQQIVRPQADAPPPELYGRHENGTEDVIRRRDATIGPSVAPMAPVVNGAAARPPPRVREGIPRAANEPRTVRRATVAAPGPPRASTTATGGRRTWMLVGASVVAVVATAAIGLGLVDHGSRSAPATTVSAPAPTLAPVAQPLAPTVTAVRVSAKRVRFAWSEADPLRGDAFEWHREGVSTWTPTAAHSVTLDVPAGDQVCLVVQITRDDNTEASPSTVKCWG